VDAVAMGGAAPVLHGIKNVVNWLKSGKLRNAVYGSSRSE